jgi:hypothetical protein
VDLAHRRGKGDSPTLRFPARFSDLPSARLRI